MSKSFGMVGGAPGGGGGSGITLASISITTPPSKLKYKVGETFSATGMVVTAKYSNGATLIVGGYTVSPQVMAIGTNSVTVTYTEAGVSRSTTQPVTVIELSSISITTPPQKVSYTIGDTFNPAGMVVQAKYSDGSTANVTGYTVSPQTMTLGTTSVTVSYTENGVTATATQAVTVSKRTPTLSVSPSSITLDATHPTATATVSTNSDGAVSVSSSDGTVATATVASKTITVRSVNNKNGAATLTVRVAETETYKAASTTVPVSATFSRLPDGYTELQYLESTGTQYIDTNEQFDEEASYELAVAVTAHNISVNRVWGVIGNKYWTLASSNYGQIMMYIGYDWGGGKSYDHRASTFSLNVKYVVTMTSLSISCPDLIFTSTSTNQTLKRMDSVVLFGARESTSDSVNFKGFAQIFSYKKMKNGQVLRDFVPAKNSSNVAGMYDLISNKFFTNNGTGAFVMGPAV